MSYCSQEPVLEGETVQDVMDRALLWHADLLAEFERSSIEGDMDAMSEAQERLDLVGWDWSHRIEAVCTRVNAPPLAAKVDSLSGVSEGIALARVLLAGADF